MNDPAFLFYSSDFLTGVMDLTMQERGQYITLLCLQHQKGHLSEKTIRLCLGFNDLNDITDVLAKFCIDENGLYYNKRLEHEVKKRIKDADASRNNGKLGGRPKKADKPKNNLQVNSRLAKTEPKQNLSENENVIDNDNDLVNDFDFDFEKDEGSGEKEEDRLFDSFWNAYPKKKSKGQAEKAWEKLNPSKELVAIMLDKLARAKTCKEWVKDNGQFIPYPATWLNAKGWEDEFEQPQSSGNPFFDYARELDKQNRDEVYTFD